MTNLAAWLKDQARPLDEVMLNQAARDLACLQAARSGVPAIAPTTDDRQKVRSEAKLIRPHPDWRLDDWSLECAAIHWIPRGALDAAEPAEAVVRWALKMAGDARFPSDAPAFDNRCLDRLLATIGEAGRSRIDDFGARRHLSTTAQDRVPCARSTATSHRTETRQCAPAACRRLARRHVEGERVTLLDRHVSCVPTWRHCLGRAIAETADAPLTACRQEHTDWPADPSSMTRLRRQMPTTGALHRPEEN